jgi:3-oxoacyl-[acyl-carrier-protein] synthase II
LDRLAALEFAAHAVTSRAARLFSITGPSTTIASGCTTGLDVIQWGHAQIASRRADMALVGASEAPLSEFIFALFAAGGFLSTWDGPPKAASRPYDLLRAGLVLAEGAGALVLEDLDHAVQRGAQIYAELIGSGGASEGGFTGSRRDIYRQGLEAALRSALADASTEPSEVDYVNAHGNSTQDDDAAETQAYKNIFGTGAFNIPISSIKSAIGQPMSAGGVLQAVATCMAVAHQRVPPTLNLQNPDPECDLDYVPNTARAVRIQTALIHAHSLGGMLPGSHTALLLARHS